jgi:FkbM family methyltransferase
LSILPTAAQITERLPRFLRRHKLMTAWMALTGESPVQLVRIRDQTCAYADMSDGFMRLIPIDGGYDDDFFRVADMFMGEGTTFLDVGANFGLLSFGLAGRHGGGIDCHLFEPNARLVAIIERSRQLYPQMRCTVNPVAVSDQAGEVSFSLNDQQSGVSHISTADESGGVVVPAITLDGYLEGKGLERVELLKIDVEGFELSALRGAEASLRARRIEAVYFEYFEKYLTRVAPPEELITFLAAAGFVTCFCRNWDISARSQPSHTIKPGLPGHGLGLLPIDGFALPAMTDLLAVPSENLTRLA